MSIPSEGCKTNQRQHLPVKKSGGRTSFHQKDAAEHRRGGVNVRFLPVLDGRYVKSRDAKACPSSESSESKNMKAAHLDEFLPLQLLACLRGCLEQRRKNLVRTLIS